MRELTAAELLQLYESDCSEASLDRAVDILAVACPETAPEQIATLSAGRRDELLLELRELTFGPRVECVADCPACGSPLEFAFHVPEIKVRETNTAPPEAVEIDGFEIRLRLPDTYDLAAASTAATVDGARAVLLDRCVTALRGGIAVAPSELPDRAIEAISAEMARCDPQADVRLSVACASCGHRWDAAFDIASFLWKEIQRAARKVLREVHTLAWAYGWSEAEILKLSAWRRQAYLSMAAAG